MIKRAIRLACYFSLTLILQGFAGSASVFAAGSVGLTGNINIDVDVAKLTEMAVNAAKSAQNRGGFLKSMSDKVFFEYDGRYNVMIINQNLSFDRNFSGTVKYVEYVYDGIPFGIFVFDDGKFINYGDGGYDNWVMQGAFTRTGSNDKTVIFWKHDREGVIFFEHTYLGGKRTAPIPKGWHNLSDLVDNYGFQNDWASSVYIPYSYVVDLYDHDWWNSLLASLGQNDNNSRNFTQWTNGINGNDRISSIVVK